MAMTEKSSNFLNHIIQRGRPIPGQSLTNAPEQPMPHERPPEFTNPREAMLSIFEALTVPEATTNTLLSLSNGVGVVDIASIVLYSGYIEGKWNEDLMVLLMEPTMFMVMALADKAEIEYNLEAGDDEAPIEMSPENQTETLQSGINQLEQMRKVAASRVSPQSVPQDVREIIEETEIPSSLLEKVEQEQATSLLGREE